MKVIILAAGYAVRLEPLTLNMPKPLLAVGNKKIIDRILDKVTRLSNADSILIITNAKFFGQFDDWLKDSRYKDKISLVNDGSTSNQTRLGAIRDIAIAVEERSLKDDLLVIAGDNIFDFDLGRFLKFAESRPDGVSIALYDIGSSEAAKSFGVLRVDEFGKIVDFEEKPQNPKSTLISTGIYYFPKNKLSNIAEYVKMQNKLDAPGYYISWLAKKDNVYGFKFTEDWYDIGSIESYQKADREYLEKERRRHDQT